MERFLERNYKSVIAGYHQNKEHWNTIILDGTISDKEIKRMIDEVMILLRTAQLSEFMKL